MRGRKKGGRLPLGGVEGDECGVIVAQSDVMCRWCPRGPQSRALQYFFFSERKCGKVEGADVPKAVGRVGVIGGGTMGSGIAMSLANAGTLLHIASHHIASHRIASHHTTSHRTTSHHIASYRIISYCVILHHIAAYRIISYHIPHTTRPN